MCVGSALAAAGAAGAAEDFSTWAHSAKVRLNTTASGANLTKSITNFALLVRINDSRILSQSMADGADVRFSDASGTALNFQIDRWSASEAEFWVHVPKIDSLSDKQYLIVYWGKPGSPWLSDGAKTFTGPGAYWTVYHLGEGATQSRSNSVGNFNHGAPQNYEGDERVRGVIGMADSLDGSAKGGDYLDLGAGFANLTKFAFTAWAKPERNAIWERFLDLGNGASDNNLVITRQNTSDTLNVQGWGAPEMFNPWPAPGGVWPTPGGTGELGSVSAKGLETGKWAFYGVVVDNQSVMIYKNGALVSQGELKASLNNVARARNFIGHSNWAGDLDFQGVLDEVQLASGWHSVDWMRLSYESQRPDGKMFTWEFAPDVKLAITTQPSGLTVAEGKPLKLTIAAVSSSPIAYQWLRDGEAILEAQDAAFLFPAATLEQAGTYTCRVTDGKDTLVSKPAAVTVPEDLATWSHSQKVFVNTTATGANLSAEVANIPVLVRLGKQSIDFTQVGAGGKDLRFSSLEGTQLAHSIERWAQDTAEVWVRLNRVSANANGYFTMHWGKSTARRGSAPGSVFSLNDNWRLYYDFSDAPASGGEALAQDATLNAYRGQGIGISSLADGVIGKAFSFTGASHVESPQAALDGLKSFTVMAWIREKASGFSMNVFEIPHILGVRLTTSSQGEFGAYSREGTLGFWQGMQAGPPFVFNAANSKVDDHAWHLVALTYTGQSLTLYADGIGLAASVAENATMGPNVIGIGGLRASNGAWSGLFTGDIDAVQVTGDAKSQDWIKLAFETQRPGSAILTFGAPAETAPPAPEIYPPAGLYEHQVEVQLICAADRASILYTLDGSEPDTLARGSTRSFDSLFRLTASATVKAKSYWNGKASATVSAVYQVTQPLATGDTLRPGSSRDIDANHRVTFPNQDSKSPVRLTVGPAWNPKPPGFDQVGPLFKLIALDSAAAFPGLAVDGDSLAGLSLYRRDPNAVILRMPPKDGQLWIPAAGAYFWARDTLPPRIRFSGASVRGDSLLVGIFIDDNVANVQGKARFGAGGLDSLGWWSAASGEVLEFTLRAPAKPETPLEVRFYATDQSRATVFPAGAAITLPRPLPALSAPLDLKGGWQWKMAGMPLLAEGDLSLRDLAAMSGTGPLYAAVWRSNPAPDTGYLILKGDDKLPAGKGFWLAAETAAPSLNFPASRALASDSDGLFSIRLSQGWNLVTCPTFRPLAWPVSIKDGDAYLSSPLKPLHALDGAGYSRPDSLRPWEAYYVYYAKDTVVRVGEGAPRVIERFRAPKATSLTKALRLNLSAPGAFLGLGASAVARPGLGREDESRPPPVDDRAAAWLSRDGRALTVDYVPWDTEHAMAWTIASRGQVSGSALQITGAEIPPGTEAWAVSPSRRLKWRLLPGSNIPVTGDDTLSIYAGSPRALAKIGDLLRGREAAGAFAARLRAVSGGFELLLELPSQAKLTLSLHDAGGRLVGGLPPRAFAPGRHALSWQTLSPSQSHLPQGVYYLTLHAQAETWTRHQILPQTLIH